MICPIDLQIAQPLPRRRLAFATSPPLVVGGACLILVLLAVAAAPLASARSDRPGGWFVAAAAAAVACWAAAVVLLRTRTARVRAVLVVAAAIQLVPVASPLLFSRDAYSYWAYARIAAAHGQSPYRTLPAAFPKDPAVREMSQAWRRTGSVYGPLFTFASEGTVVAGDEPRVAAKLWQVGAAAGVLALAALAALLSPLPAFAAAFVGWNPLLAVHFGGGGHNDVWMMVLLLGALLAERRSRRRLAGALWACSVAVKWVPLALLPLRAAGPRRRSVSWPALVVTAAAIAAGATVLYGTGWLGVATPLLHNVGVGTRVGVPHLLHLPWPVMLAALGAGYALLLRASVRGRERFGLAACLLLCTTPWLFPWYAVWAIPLAAAKDDSAALMLAGALSAYLLIGYRLV
jgi:hypothetical protein